MNDSFDEPNRRPPVYTLTKIDRVIRRHKKIIIGLPLVSIAGTLLALSVTPSVYQSQTRIIFTGQNETYIESQKEIIRSPQIINAAAKELNLIPAHQKPKFKTLNIAPSHNNDESNEDTTPSPVTQYIAHNLQIERLPNSYALRISFADQSPVKAANIVNAVTQSYISRSKTTKTSQNEISSDITPLLEQQIKHAQEELALFGQTDGRAYPVGFTAAISKAKAAEYERAHLNLAEIKAQLFPFLNAYGELEMNEQAPEILRSSHLQNLKIKRAELREQHQNLSRRYGYKHPKMIAVNTALSMITSQIDDEQNNIMHRVHNEFLAAQNRLETIEKPQDDQAIEQTQKLRQERLIILQNRLTAAKAILKAYKNTNTPEQVQTPQVQWIARGFIPTKPIYPDKRKTLGIITLLSVFLGFAAAFLLEKLRSTFLSGRELEEVTGVPCYALIPQATQQTLQNRSKNNIVDDILHAPSSPVAESIRALRLTTKLRAANVDSKVITVTSSFPNEGKTTLALWMARLAAKAGERVIIIDADLRRPCINHILGKDNKASLVEYITKQNKMEDIIDTGDPSGAHIIYGRNVKGSAIDHLSSARMEHLIRSLRKAYDLIIIDTPACMASPDAQALAKLSDTILYAVHWNKTRREIVQSGLSQFHNTNGKTQIATVLTNIDLPKHIEYGFGHSFFDYETPKSYAAI